MPLRRGARLAPLLLALCAAARPADPPSPTPPSPVTHASPRTAPPDVELSWRVLRLENGLQVVLHRDPGIPEVAVELWLRGGAADDAPDRPGQAHFFEHTGLPAARLFANRANYAAYVASIRDGNAWTGYDFLRFFTQVEPRGLELALAMMADRLGGRPETITQARVDRDRNIVLNELRRSQDTEWDAELGAHLAAGTFGAGHPYAHARGGSIDGVQASTLDELQAWHRSHVGAASALLLIAGDFDPARAEALVRHWFSGVRSGSPVAHVTPPPAPSALREVLEKALPSPAVYLTWPLPAWGSEDGDRMILFARVLQDRLDRRTAVAGSPITATEAKVELHGAAGQLTIRGDVARRGGHSAAEAALRAEIDSLVTRGPTVAELERARARVRGDFVRGLQRPAWLGGRLEVLGMGMMYRGDPGWYRTRLAHTDSATVGQMRDVARRWLSSPGYTLYVVPPGSHAATDSVEWSATVALAADRPATFPTVARSILPGGTHLLIAERHELPLAQFTLALAAGYGTDAASTAGRARMTADALPRIPVTPSNGGPLPLADAIGALGGELTTEVDDRFAHVSISVPAERADAAAALLASALTRGPTASGVAAARTQALARLASAAGDPKRVGTRVLACALSGGVCTPSALDGEGTRGSLSSLTDAGIHSFVAERWRAGSAVIAISGDVTRERAQVLAQRIAAALPQGTAGDDGYAAPAQPRGAVLIVDRPGAQQSQIVLAQAFPSVPAIDWLPTQLLSSVMGAQANQRLREEKQWSYGASASLEPWHGGLLLRVEAPVQTDRTADAVAELLAQARALRDGTAVAPALLAERRNWLARGVSWSVTSLPELNDLLVDLERYALPPDYYADFLRRAPQAGDSDVAAAARNLLHPDGFVWVIVGDRAQIETPIRQLNLGEVRVADPSGLW